MSAVHGPDDGGSLSAASASRSGRRLPPRRSIATPDHTPASSSSVAFPLQRMIATRPNPFDTVPASGPPSATPLNGDAQGPASDSPAGHPGRRRQRRDNP